MAPGADCSFQEFPSKDGSAQPEDKGGVEDMYRDFDRNLLVPLWAEIGNLMPLHPEPVALAHSWRWQTIFELAERAGALVPVGRGGERRALALANPGLGGRPFATPTIWAAIQYLNAGELAPSHRHSQNAFRFILEGGGVWTVVNGDSISMRRGDFLPQGAWNWHSHYNPSDSPMAWLDGLDIPFVFATDSAFFEPGDVQTDAAKTPELSRSERLWAYPGLQPLSVSPVSAASPLGVYRWENTDAALSSQLELEAEGYPGVVEPGHAAIRYVNPRTAGDALPTLRAEFHRLRAGCRTTERREVGSSVWQVFEGRANVVVGGTEWTLERGDLFAVPSWQSVCIGGETPVDLFRFSDTPIFEALHQYRFEVNSKNE